MGAEPKSITKAGAVAYLLENCAHFRVKMSGFAEARCILQLAAGVNRIPGNIGDLPAEVGRRLSLKENEVRVEVGNEYSLVIYITLCRTLSSGSVVKTALEIIGNKYKADEITIKKDQFGQTIVRYWWD